MRLRLSVQRNNLPATNILWSVPDTNSPQAYTIARLLEDVNRVVPLEAEQWGLEDYTVEVAGFECLHFSPVFQTLKEDDHVAIRPLLTAEVRSRTLCGRHQISDGGQHLVDGIPFGRPYLRQPNRPVVRIPPRKRRRLEGDTVAGDEPEIAGLITANGEDLSQPSSAASGDSITDKTIRRTLGSRKDRKSVRFAETDGDVADDSDDDDEDFAPRENSEGSDASTEDDGSSIITSSASDSSSDVSDSPLSGSDSDSDPDSDLDSESDSEESSSASDDESVSSAPEVLPAKAVAPHRRSVPPGKGSKVTKTRNRRRQESQKLKILKDAGQLHYNATLQDLRNYSTTQKSSTPLVDEVRPAKKMATPAGKRKRFEEDPTADTAVDETSELERRKQELMAKFEEPTPDVTTPESKVARTEEPQPEEMPSTQAEEQPQPKERPAKRLRPDTTAIGRILARQTRALEKKPPKAKQVTAEEAPPEPEGASDPDFWKSKINLSAFECWDEDHELSAPPFPFKQHWDPASKLMRAKLNAKKKKNKRPSKSRSPQSPVGENEDEDALILDYDDSPSTAKQDSDPTAAIESQLMQDVDIAAKPDLPPLPEDIDSLPALDSADIKVGTVIAFQHWTIDPQTITPQISDYKTAVVEKEGDSGNGAGTFRLKFAERDIIKREEKVDKKGNRVYRANDGFQMDEEEEEEDSSIWEGTFGELITPKLLKAAE